MLLNQKILQQMYQKPNFLDELKPLENELKPLRPFPTSSSFYDDLNLEDCSKSNKLISNFMNTKLPVLSLDQQPASRDTYFNINNDQKNIDTTYIKKKKLTNYSLSSSNLPHVSVTYNDPNNSALSYNDTENLSTSSYNTSLTSSMSNSCMSSSSSYNSNLGDMRNFTNQSWEFANNNVNTRINNSNGSGYSENLYPVKSMNSQRQPEIPSSRNSHYDFRKMNQLQNPQHGNDMFNHSANAENYLPSWNDNLIENYGNNARQLQPNNNKFPKKITKSSTTLFHENPMHNPHKHAQVFPHSTTFDNIASLSKMNKPMKPLEPFLGHSTNDFLLENSFSNTSGMNNVNKYNNSLVQHANQMSQYGNKTNLMQHQSMNSMQNNSMLNTSNILNTSTMSNTSACQKDLPILHVRNLDYKISADEWKRILLENFRKHCKEILSVNVVTNSDKSLLGIVKLATKEDAKLAISCLNHKKIGYKRLNVGFATTHNSPKSKIISLLKTNELKEMPLTRFISLYEAKYNQSIAINELFSLKEIVQIFHKDGQGRQIKLIGRNFQSSLDNEEENSRYSPFCSLHSQKTEMSYQMNSLNANASSINSSSPIVGWLPNVIVSLRTFKSAVHKLLNDHGGQMPLLSFMDCYKCCIFNENSLASNHRGNNSLAINQSTGNNLVNGNMTNTIANNSNSAGQSNDLSYQLIIDNENGVSLEHLITCAQDVQIQYNQGFFKQLQWENDKSKPINLQSRNSTTALKSKQSLNDQTDGYCNDLDDSIEDSQRKINQFSHEVVELFKEKPRCIIQMSNFTTEYHKKYGRQLRLADYDSNLYQNLKELLESIPHILQILDSQYDKKLTLTHRVQVRRFSNDLIKVLKSHPTKQMFADEYPISYEKHFGRKFEIRDYGVCYLEDMLAELPESIICRKEIEGRTFIQIPKIVQMDEERLCTNRLTFDIIDMLKHKLRFSIQFNKFIPNFHHHFGRQCKLSNYGFTKLIELLEAMPHTVHVINKDNLQFVQLKENIMLDLICINLVKYLEENNMKIKVTLAKLEEIYNSRYEAIFYQDFGCLNINQLFEILPLKKHFICSQVCGTEKPMEGSIDWMIQCESFNEKEMKRAGKLMLKKLVDEKEDTVMFIIKESKVTGKPFRFTDFNELLMHDNQINPSNTIHNNRSMHYLQKCMSDYLVFDEKDEKLIIGFSDLYIFAKQIRTLFKYSKLPANDMTMTIPELEFLYNQAYIRYGFSKDSSFKMDHLSKTNSDHGHSCLPFKRLGYIDVTLLLSQGINLLVTVKKYAEKRICLNREFWSKSNVLDSIAQNHIQSDSFSSPISPINQRINNRTPFTNITPLTNNSNGTPLSERITSFSSQNSLNFSKLSFNGNNTNTSLFNTSSNSNDAPIPYGSHTVNDL